MSKRIWVSRVILRNDDLMFRPETGDIICVRDRDGTPRTNVFRRVDHYGVEQDWHGTTPSRKLLALNILDLYLPPHWRVGGSGRDKSATTQTWGGNYVSDECFALHIRFSNQVVANIPQEGGVIPGWKIEDWLAASDIVWTRDVWRLARDRGQ